MEMIPALLVQHGRVSDATIATAALEWVDMGFPRVQFVINEAGPGLELCGPDLGQACAAVSPRGAIEVRTGSWEPARIDSLTNRGVDRVVLDLAAACGTAAAGEVAGLLRGQQQRLAVDLPLLADCYGPDSPLGPDVSTAATRLARWGIERIIVDLTVFGGRLPQETAATLEDVLRESDAEVLIRVAELRARDLRNFTDRLPRELAGVVVDPAQSLLAVAEMGAALQDRVEVESSIIADQYLLPGGIPPWLAAG